MSEIVVELTPKTIKTNFGNFELVEYFALKQTIVTGMQPYLFPYIGYFQLLECSDIFVVGDDVQYIQGGWINRNRILINQEPYWLTIPVQRAPHNLLINQRYYVEDRYYRNKILDKIEYVYRKAPFFADVFPYIKEIMEFGSNNVSEFNTNAIRRLAWLMEIKCQIVVSSELKKNSLLMGQEHVIDVNRRLGATHYINPIGGVSLYKERDFIENGMELSFIKPENIHYSQFSGSFVPFLSIIDVLMFCSLDEVKRLLKQYRLLKQAEIN